MSATAGSPDAGPIGDDAVPYAGRGGLPAGRRSRFALPARQLGTLSGLAALSLGLWILTPHFLTVSNLLNVAEQTSINAVVAIGMTVVILSGGIDLSVGSIVALSGVVLGTVLGTSSGPEAGIGASLPFALLLALATGVGCGLINGALVSWGRLPPFIVTLGMMSIARGIALLLTEGRPVSGFAPAFRALATGRLGFIPAPIIITIVAYATAHFVLTRTTFGRYVYAIGGNEEATRLSGVAVRFHKTMIYGVSGLTSALGAVMLTARLNSAQPIAGTMYELDAIAATVIGGTSLSGGEGSLAGTLVGALIMGVLRNGLNLLGVSSFLQQVVIGSVIIVAVLIDTVLKRRHNS
jgi:ribose transport system permease protein